MADDEPVHPTHASEMLVEHHGRKAAREAVRKCMQEDAHPADQRWKPTMNADERNGPRQDISADNINGLG